MPVRAYAPFKQERLQVLRVNHYNLHYFLSNASQMLQMRPNDREVKTKMPPIEISSSMISVIIGCGYLQSQRGCNFIVNCLLGTIKKLQIPLPCNFQLLSMKACQLAHLVESLDCLVVPCVAIADTVKRLHNQYLRSTNGIQVNQMIVTLFTSFGCGSSFHIQIM